VPLWFISQCLARAKRRKLRFQRMWPHVRALLCTIMYLFKHAVSGVATVPPLGPVGQLGHGMRYVGAKRAEQSSMQHVMWPAHSDIALSCVKV